jgi:tripartite-type tricarboxylate transporter receptor subunit TctC
MKSSRRRFLRYATAAVAVPVLAPALLPSFGGVARAQAWPSQPLRWVVGFPPGGSGDIVARIMAAWLAERLGQPVVIENKPGASTNISIQAVVNAPPDGNTLLFIAASAALNVSLFQNLPFDLQRDIAPVSAIIDFPLVLLAHPSLPAKTVPELIAYAKANPGKINFGSFGTGTTSHVAGELFKMTAGIEMTHVPYRGGAPMMIDLIGGQVQLAFDVLTGALPHIKSGDIRALAMAGGARYQGLPDGPTMGETMPLFVANAGGGIGGPRGTPPEIVARLNREVNAGLKEPAVRQRLDALATTPMFFTPDEFGTYISAEIEKWRKVVAAANIKVQ